MQNLILVLIGLTLLDALFIYWIVRGGGAGTEATLYTMCLTGMLSIVWPLTVLA